MPTSTSSPRSVALLAALVLAGVIAALGLAAQPARASMDVYGEGATNTEGSAGTAWAVKPSGNANKWWWYINADLGVDEAVCYRYQVNNDPAVTPNGSTWHQPTSGGTGTLPQAGTGVCEGPYRPGAAGYIPSPSVPKQVTNLANGTKVQYCADEWYKDELTGWQKSATSGSSRCQKIAWDNAAPSASVDLKQGGVSVSTTNDPANVVINIDYDDAVSPPRYHSETGVWGDNYACTTTSAACNASSSYTFKAGCSTGSQTKTQTFQCAFGNPPSDGTYYSCFKVYDGAVTDALPSNAGFVPSDTNHPQSWPYADGNFAIACDSITVDRAAPETTIDSGPANGSTTSSASPSFGFSASEAATFQCSVDGGSYSSCTSPKTIGPLANGSHTFAVKATDSAGNVDSTPASRTFTVNTSGPSDTTPPDTTIDSGPANGSTTSTASPSFGFSANEAATFQCSVDGGSYSSCTSPKTIGPLANGSHTFAVKATDTAGNVDATPASRTFTVNTSAPPDTTPPDTTIDSGPANGSTTSNASPSFGFSANESASFQCSVDGGSYSSCTSPKTIGPLANGSHTFAVKATDTAGNVDATPASRTFTVSTGGDTTPPETTITAGPANGSTLADPTPHFSFSADETSTFGCSVDGGSFDPCGSPKVIGPLSEGAHTFAVRATDTAGNVDPTPASRSFIVDTVMPDTTITSGPANGSTTSSTSPSFGFTSNEAGATFECSVDGGGYSACTSPKTIGPLADGSHSFSVRAKDAGNNVDNTPASRSFTVATGPPPDTTPPETTIDSGPANGSTTTNPSPSFGFSANEAGAFECSVDGGAYGACTSPTTIGPLADGSHTFAVRATDTSGNVDGTPASRSFTVDTSLPPDTTPPDTTITAGPANGSTLADPTPHFSFSADESSTFGCSVDGGSYDPCSSPKVVGPLSEGAHTFSVRATDTAGNVDPTPASRSFTVDTSGPETTITSGPADGSTIADPTPSFGFSASEASTFSCSVDGAAFSSCTSPKTLPTLSDGDHTFSVRATDTVGNVDNTPASRSFTVDTGPPSDTTPPQTTIDSGPPAKTKSKKAHFEFSSNEAGTFSCSLDGGPFIACVSPLTKTVGKGKHTLAVRARDAAGNADPTPATHSWTVKKKKRKHGKR